jgi:Integrase core domain
LRLHHPAGRRPRPPQRLRARAAPSRREAEERQPEPPQTQGKVERLWQTLKKWLAAQTPQPATITELQALLHAFTAYYNTARPHRSLPHRATPAAACTARPKAAPGDRAADTHDRVRVDIIGTTGTLTLRHAGRLYHIGVGRTHARTHILMLIQDLHVRIIDAATRQLLRDLILDPGATTSPPGTRPDLHSDRPEHPDTPDPDVGSGCPRCLETSHSSTATRSTARCGSVSSPRFAATAAQINLAGRPSNAVGRAIRDAPGRCRGIHIRAGAAVARVCARRPLEPGIVSGAAMV